MNETDPSGDLFPPGTLPRWATITQVSASLGAPRNAVRSAVRRAVKNGEQWVKKETPDKSSMPVYLINTNHTAYQAHARRWKQNTVSGAALYELDEQARDTWEFSEVASHSQWLPPSSSTGLYNALEREYPDLHALPGLCSWLWSHGLQIFKNILAEEEQEAPWQWRWGDLHGEGYESSETALVAALQCWFERDRQGRGRGENRPASEEKEQSMPLASSSGTSASPEESPRFWFRKKRTGWGAS